MLVFLAKSLEGSFIYEEVKVQRGADRHFVSKQILCEGYSEEEAEEAERPVANVSRAKTYPPPVNS